jgi:hypothetical protein
MRCSFLPGETDGVNESWCSHFVFVFLDFSCYETMFGSVTAFSNLWFKHFKLFLNLVCLILFNINVKNVQQIRWMFKIITSVLWCTHEYWGCTDVVNIYCSPLLLNKSVGKLELLKYFLRKNTTTLFQNLNKLWLNLYSDAHEHPTWVEKVVRTSRVDNHFSSCKWQCNVRYMVKKLKYACRSTDRVHGLKARPLDLQTPLLTVNTRVGTRLQG